MIKTVKLIKALSALIIIVFALNSCGLDPSKSAGVTENDLYGNILQSRQLEGEVNTFSVMAPLKVYDWNAFESNLYTVKGYGVQAVSVDVWWGDVEANGDNSFDWSYYDIIFGKIRAAGLDVMPIMSFHQCGGSVGDDYNSYLPSWIWNKFSGTSEDDLKYQSETGAYSSAYISLWADDLVIPDYIDFMNSFKDHFAYMASDIMELNISGGTAGELRYPSYNAHDWGSYGNRGTLQAYGNFAQDDFRNDMVTKYGSLSGVNSAWSSSLLSIYDIAAPSDANAFFNNWDYKNTQYGRDFIDWYNQSLKEHGKRLIEAAKTAFDSEFSNIDLGMKIPGIHWEISNPNYPRLAEMTAGLIKVSDDFQSSTSGYGYNNIIDTFVGNDRQVNLHFTCLEMGNDEGDAYSKAQDLVFWLSDAALDQNVRIKGENALSGGVTTNYGWDHIDNAFANGSFTGLTVLRMGNVSYGTGQSRYSNLINTYGNTQPTEWNEAYFRGTTNSWGTSLMSKNSVTGLWETTQDFGTDNPRFKITHYTDWTEAYPAADVLITEGAGTYKITFDETGKDIKVIKEGNVIPGDDLIIHFKEWESASIYSVHPWAGLAGDIPMSYEGKFGGSHWWSVTITDAPADFMFCFNNSNGSWDGVDRHYIDQGDDIYITQGDSTIYTDRP